MGGGWEEEQISALAIFEIVAARLDILGRSEEAKRLRAFRIQSFEYTGTCVDDAVDLALCL